MYVIAGVTGHTGSVVASTLLAARQPVRVIVRDAAKGEPWRAKGADVAVAAFQDRAALARALAGATGAYLLAPPFGFGDTGIPAERAALAKTIVGAVTDAKPGHVVFLSSIGAELPSGTGPIQFLYPIESGLRDSGVPTTFLRAAFFQENWDAMAAGAIEAGALYYGIPAGVAFSQVATADIGKTAARLLVEGAPRGGTRIVELAGPQDLTLEQTAAVLAEVGGKPVQAVAVPTSAMIDSLVGMGASRDVATLYGEMGAAIGDGRIAWRGTPERGTITLAQHLRETLKR